MIDKQNYFTYIDNTSDDTDKAIENLYKRKEIKEQYYKLEQECEFWKKELDRTHLLMLERQDELVKEILKNDQLNADNEILEKDKANLDAIIETLKAQFKQLENENKDLEIEKYKDLALYNGKVCNERLDKIDELEHKVNRMEEGYIELAEIVAPYIDDFTGYNEEQCGFDIVLCVRELMQQLDQLKEEVEKQRALKQTYLTCYKTKHGDVKGKLFKYERYKEALQSIKKIIEVNKVELEECLVHDIDDQILQKNQ